MKLIHLLKNLFTGDFVIGIGNNKVVSFPKIAPYMVVLLPIMGYMVNNYIKNPITWILVFIIVILVLFGFFYYSLLPKEKVNTLEEWKKDNVIAINVKKEDLLNSNDKPSINNTKGEIIDYLEKNNIEFNKNDSKTKLLEKISK